MRRVRGAEDKVGFSLHRDIGYDIPLCWFIPECQDSAARAFWKNSSERWEGVRVSSVGP